MTRMITNNARARNMFRLNRTKVRLSIVITVLFYRKSISSLMSFRQFQVHPKCRNNVFFVCIDFLNHLQGDAVEFLDPESSQLDGQKLMQNFVQITKEINDRFVL